MCDFNDQLYQPWWVTVTLVMTYEDEVKFLATSLSVPPSATGVKWSFGSERGCTECSMLAAREAQL